MGYQELFVVEHIEDGKTLDIGHQGYSGFSVFTNLAEARDAVNSEADCSDEPISNFRIVKFYREQPEESERERVAVGE